MLLVPIMLVQKYTRALLRGSYRIAEFALIVEFLPAALRLGLVAFTLYVLTLGLDGIVWVPIWVNCAVNIALFISLRKQIIAGLNKGDFLLGAKDMKSIFVFGAKSHLGAFIQKSNTQIAMAIITAVLEPRSVGFLSLGFRIVNILSNLTNSVATVLVTKLARSSLEEIRSFFPALSRILLSSMSFVGICAAVVLPFVVNLAYGAEYRPVVTLCWLLIPGVVFLAIVRITNAMFTQTGKPLVKSGIRGCGFGANVLLLVLLLPKFELNAAAAAMTASYLVMFAISVLLAKRRLEVSIRELLILRMADINYVFGSCRRLAGSLTLPSWLSRRSVSAKI